MGKRLGTVPAGKELVDPLQLQLAQRLLSALIGLLQGLVGKLCLVVGFCSAVSLDAHEP